MKRQLKFLLAGSLLSLIAACGKQANTNIPLDEIRAVNNDISATYVRVNELLDFVAAESTALGELPEGVRARDLDVALLRKVMAACFNYRAELQAGVNPDEVPRKAEPVVGTMVNPLTQRSGAGRLTSCKPPEMVSLESYLDVVPKEIKDLVIDRIIRSDAQRANLQDVAVKQLDDLQKHQLDAEGKLAELKQTAAERLEAAKKSGDAAVSRKAEIDLDEFNRQADQVDSVLKEIGERFRTMEQFRRTLVDQTTQNITKLGTAVAPAP